MYVFIDIREKKNTDSPGQLNPYRNATPRHATVNKSTVLLSVYKFKSSLPKITILVESDLSSSLHIRGILVESAVRLVALLLNGGAVLHQLLGHGLAGGLEDVDQSSREVLLGFPEEGDGAAVLACAAGTGWKVSIVKKTIRLILGIF